MDESFIIESGTKPKSPEVHTHDNDTSELDLSSRSLTVFDSEVLSNYKAIESINLSNNRLRTFPKGLQLPHLRKLDLSNNNIENITFFSDYTSLEEVNISGNPQLQISDKFLLVTWLPELRLIDGEQCNSIRDEINRLDFEIDKQIEKECDKELRAALCSASFDCNTFKRNLELKMRAVAVNENQKKVFNYKIEQKVAKKVEDEYRKLKSRFETKPNDELLNNSEQSDKKGDVKMETAAIVHSSRTVPPRKREVGELSAKMESKRGRTDTENPKFDYDAMLFIRCHSSRNDPYDSVTQVWKAAFAPKVSNKDMELVASCGGNIVCLIDCTTATVKKRYCDANTNERFFCLSWTTIPSDTDFDNLTLAVGGSESYIVLLHGTDLVCYCKFKAHDKDVNTLLFHPTKPTWLFSGSYDQRIKVWDIDEPSKDKSKVPKLLLEVNSQNYLLQFVFSEKHNLLIAAGEEGITFWPSFSVDKQEPILGQIVFSKNKLIDGLAIFPEYEDLLAVKRSRTALIDVINLKVLLNDFANAHSRSSLPSFRRTQFKSCLQFEYSNTSDDYMYLAVERGLMVCGDQRGKLWMYDTRNIPFHSLKEKRLPKIAPNLILKWPAINNPTHNEKKIVDEKNPIVNAVAISTDLKYVVAVTNINLVCLWKRAVDS